MINMLPKFEVKEKILLALAQNKKSRTHYQLWTKDKVAASNKTVLTSLSYLEKKGLIESHQERKGRKRKFYNLTMKGVFYALSLEEDHGKINLIINNYQRLLPIFFGRWGFFHKQGLREWAHKMLRNLTKNPLLPIQRLAISYSPEHFEKMINYHLCDIAFNVEFYPPQPKDHPDVIEQKARISKLRKDPELDQLIGELLRKKGEDARKRAKDSEWWETWYFSNASE